MPFFRQRPFQHEFYYIDRALSSLTFKNFSERKMTMPEVHNKKQFDMNFGFRDGGQDYRPGETKTKQYPPEVIERYLRMKYGKIEKPRRKKPIQLRRPTK